MRFMGHSDLKAPVTYILQATQQLTSEFRDSHLYSPGRSYGVILVWKTRKRKGCT